jgi:putative toxin-antitoxin system antitoxin component (TIGR02293 family)
MNVHVPQPISYAQISKGIAAKQVAKWVKSGDLTWADVYRVVPERTFKRRLAEAALLRRDEADAIARMLRIGALAAYAFQDRALAATFLDTPNPSLGNHLPRVMAETDAGARDVEALLTRFMHGVYG